jgi:hypothetical protein
MKKLDGSCELNLPVLMKEALPQVVRVWILFI